VGLLRETRLDPRGWIRDPECTLGRIETLRALVKL
jgi:hypothetical protein